MNSKLSHYPEKPSNLRTQNAFTILSNTYDTCSAFLNVFEMARKNRKAKGVSTDEEQDLLRAMLIFAASGLDSTVKQLVRDALPSVIEKEEGSQKAFQSHIEKKMATGGELNTTFISSVLVSIKPREELINQVIRDLTSGSLQSKNELLNVGSYFDIPSKKLTRDFDFLEEIFAARNQIAHEMDVDFRQPNRNRRPRSKTIMIKYTNEVLRIAGEFLRKVDEKL